MLGKIVARQGVGLIKAKAKIKKLEIQCNELDAENQALYEENKEIRNEIEELKLYKNNTVKMHEDIVRNLFNIQEVSRLGIDEKEKDKHRNIIINKILKELFDDRKSI
jgi:hypothetical protein